MRLSYNSMNAATLRDQLEMITYVTQHKRPSIRHEVASTHAEEAEEMMVQLRRLPNAHVSSSKLSTSSY